MSKAHTLFRPLVVRVTEGSEHGEGSFGGLEVLPDGLPEGRGCGLEGPEVRIGAVLGLKQGLGLGESRQLADRAGGEENSRSRAGWGRRGAGWGRRGAWGD